MDKLELRHEGRGPQLMIEDAGFGIRFEVDYYGHSSVVIDDLEDIKKIHNLIGDYIKSIENENI